MVLGRAADEGQVDPRQFAPRRHREIRAVGHQPIDEDRQGVAGRTAGRLARRLGVAGDGLGVAGAGLEHHGASAAAARFQIDHRPDAVAQRMLAEEGPRPVQVQLLRIGQQDDQRPVRPAPRLDRPHRLQDRRDAARIVGGPRRVRHAVVMGHQGDGGQAGISPRQNSDDIDGSQRAGVAAVLLDPRHSGRRQGAGLQAGLQPQGGQPLNQIGLDLLMFSRSDRMGRAGDAAYIDHGPLGGKADGGRRGRQGRGRLAGENGQPQGGGQGREKQDQPHTQIPRSIRRSVSLERPLCASAAQRPHRRTILRAATLPVAPSLSFALEPNGQPRSSPQ